MIKKIMKRLLKRQDKNIVQAIQSLKVDSVFTDSFGNKHNVYNGLKDILKPGWKQNFKREFTFALPGKRGIHSRKKLSERKLKMIGDLLKDNDLDIRGKSVLEIGCYEGTVSMMMKAEYNTINTCSDIAKYYIIQRGECINNDTIAEQNVYLKTMRQLYMNAWGLNEEDIQFVDDDICDTGLHHKIYDMIFSFETLEHIKYPETAFENMIKLLKPGGIMFHHYNPFFSITGGHSFATTNMLWGHALLNSNDMEAYLCQYEPDIAERALCFMQNNLNRMTTADLKSYAKNNLEIIYMDKRGFYDYSEIIPGNAENIINGIYSTAEKDDLIYDEIILMMRKKD